MLIFLKMLFLFLEICGSSLHRTQVGDKTLLLLTENLDEICNGLGNIGQKQFRAYLQN